LTVDNGFASTAPSELTPVGSTSAGQAPEAVHLDALVNSILDQRADALRSRGADIYRFIKPVAVIADRDLAAALVDAAVDWAAEPGHRLVVSLEVRNWPAHGRLTLRSTQTVMTGGIEPQATSRAENSSGQLVSNIAHAIDAMVERVTSSEGTLLTIEFPRTVLQIDGLTAMDVDFGPDSAAGTASRGLAGHRVLIITSDVRLRDDTKAVCRSTGMILDSVPSSRMAVRFCELEIPDLIIVDEHFKDKIFDELRADLLRLQPNFPFIEITYDSNSLFMAGWMGENMACIDRNQLAAELAQTMMLEMTKVR
jgi:AcrR family transcriptional regulator